MAKPVRHGNKWRIRWIDSNGSRRSAVFQDRQTAQLQLKRYEAETAEVKLGVRIERPPDKSFDELCDYWLENRTRFKRSPKDDESIIRLHLRRFFGKLSISAITRIHIDEFTSRLTHLSRKSVHNILILFKSILNLAIDLGWLKSTPKIHKPKIRLFGKDYAYLRTEDEVARFLFAARTEGEVVCALYATAIYTGMRAGELAGLRWSDVDFERRLITVQRSFDKPTKSDEVRYVPVLDALLSILREWRRKSFSSTVFPNQDGVMYGPSGRIFQEVLHRVLAGGSFPTHRDGSKKPYIVFHDLRHTFASHWVMKGGDLFKLQKILGHKHVQMTMRYAHLNPDVFIADHGIFNTHHNSGKLIEMSQICSRARNSKLLLPAKK